MKEYQNLKEMKILQNEPNLPDTSNESQETTKKPDLFCKNEPNSQTVDMPVNKARTDAYDEKTQDSRRNNNPDSDYMRSLYARMPMAMQAIEEMDAKSTD